MKKKRKEKKYNIIKIESKILQRNFAQSKGSSRFDVEVICIGHVTIDE